MSKALRLVLVGIALLATVACGGDRYELTANHRGAVYRLDKRTGEVILISGWESYRVMSPEETAAQAKQAPSE